MKNYNDIHDDKDAMARFLDTIYSKGYDKAYNDRKIEEEFDEDRAKAIEEAYQKGLCEAWIYAKKISGCTYARRTEILGAYIHPCDVFTAFSPREVIEKINKYEENQEKSDDEIKVGDEVIHETKGTIHIITKIIRADYACYIDNDGTVGYINPTKYKKTGRHVDIPGILD